jgi:hypothetical protein
MNTPLFLPEMLSRENLNAERPRYSVVEKFLKRAEGLVPLAQNGRLQDIAASTISFKLSQVQLQRVVCMCVYVSECASASICTPALAYSPSSVASPSDSSGQRADNQRSRIFAGCSCLR